MRTSKIQEIRSYSRTQKHEYHKKETLRGRKVESTINFQMHQCSRISYLRYTTDRSPLDFQTLKFDVLVENSYNTETVELHCLYYDFKACIITWVITFKVFPPNSGLDHDDQLHSAQPEPVGTSYILSF